MDSDSCSQGFAVNMLKKPIKVQQYISDFYNYIIMTVLV